MNTLVFRVFAAGFTEANLDSHFKILWGFIDTRFLTFVLVFLP